MNIIAYLRVSTKTQGQSGLGLEAQDAAIRAFAAGRAVLHSYTEVESGRRCDRPELDRALAHCRRSGATLVIAKLDRLARNVRFISAIMDSDVPFVSCDNPHANRLTLHILAAVAEAEAAMISQRVKDALAARRARGLPMGAQIPACRNLTDKARGEGRARSAQIRGERARLLHADLVPQIRLWRAENLSFATIAKKLNLQGQLTRAGKPWRPGQIHRILEKA